MKDQYFTGDAKILVDMLFDNKCFREDVTRDSMNGIEEFISYTMQSRFDLYIKAEKLFERINNKK